MIDLLTATVMGCLAHRGQATNPTVDEETRQAIIVAFDKGCDVELDVHLTQDNIPVMQHDATLQRTLGQPGVVHDYTAAEYLSFRTIPNGQKPITYQTALRVLSHYPDRHMVIEVPYGWWTTSSLGNLQTIAEQAGVLPRLTLYAGDLTQVSAIHTACPDTRIGIKGLGPDADPTTVPSYVRTVFLNRDATATTVGGFADRGALVIAANALNDTDFNTIQRLGFEEVSTNRTAAWKKWSRTHA